MHQSVFNSKVGLFCKISRLIIFILFVLAAASDSSVFAQNSKWVHFYGPVSVNSMASEGNILWIGTDFGLIRYDMTTDQKELYQTSNSGLPDNKVKAVAVDSKGNKWIGTQIGGIAKFDGHNWSVTKGAFLNYLRSIIIDREDNIWCLTLDSWGNFSKFDGKSWTLYRDFPPPLVYRGIRSIAVDKNNIKWFATEEGILKYDGINQTIYKLSDFGSPYKAATSICIASDSTIWAANPGGIFHFDGTNGTFYNFTVFGLKDYDIRSVFPDNDNFIWVSTTKGVFKFKDYSWENYTSSNSGLPGNIVNSFMNDGHGFDWLATDKGLAKFDGKNWTRIKLFNETLPSSEIYSIKIDKYGTKWICTADGGLVKFDGRNWTVFNKSNSPLKDNTIFNVAIDSQNTKWIVYRYGLAIFNDTTWTVYPDDHIVFSGSRMQCLAIDSKGNKWLGSDNGLTKFNNGKILNYYYPDNSKIPGIDISAIAIDSQDKIYIGTSNNNNFGIFDGTNWTNYNSSNSKLPNSPVSSITADSQNNIWLTAGNSVLKYNGTSFQAFTGPDSLHPVNFSSLAFDADGNKWIGRYGGQYGQDDNLSNYGGFFKLDGSSWTKYDNFNSELPDMNVNSLTIDKDGNKWISTRFSGVHVYREEGVTFTNVENSTSIQPDKYGLSQNYPNPFNPSTNISYSIPEGQTVKLTVHDVLGKEVETLVNEYKPAGKYSVQFNARNLPSGIYIYTLQTGKYRVSRKLIILK